ncbi:MAG: AEC family transporter [Candidatus Omnitrophica bacterium]|nr:AEC family transporter [Candidatus Omnitrophota bacterium]
MSFAATFLNIFSGMVEIAAIVIAGFIFFRSKLLTSEGLHGLTSLTINLFLPCLIFSHFVKNFDFSSTADWWIYPIIGIVISAIGAFVGKIMLSFNKNIGRENEFISLLAYQNCGYLPLVLVKSIFPEIVSGVLLVYIFLFMQGYNLIFWSVGIQYLTKKNLSQVSFKKVFNPPFISLLLSIFLVGFKIHGYIPAPITRAVTLLGDCTPAAALLTLGGVLAGCIGQLRSFSKTFLQNVVAGKLIILPAIIFSLLYLLHLPRLMAILIMIEAVMPSAINLSVVSFNNKPECSLVSQGVLITHILSILTIPLFMSIFAFFVK